MHDKQILNSFIWRRFKDIDWIEWCLEQVLSDALEQKIKFEEATRESEHEDMDFNLLFECYIDWELHDVDLYYIKDNEWNAYITEWGSEKQ